MRFTKLFKTVAGMTLAVLLTLVVSAEFAKTNTYTEGQFTDVKSTSWYSNEVKSAYELGFMNGMTATSFEPSGNVTVAQGITMAARIHAINLGTEVPANTEGAWYNSAVKYSVDNGIFADGKFDSYTRPIKRYEMAELIYATMPTDAFEKKNMVYSIPDVSNSASYKDKLLALYNAGIVMGSDDYGSFNPNSNITRAECSAIINRVAIPENRLTKTLLSKQTKDAYILCQNTTFADTRNGINSGWVYDNRGGAPRFSLDGSYNSLNDISEKYGTSLIREFNPIYTGVIVAETSLSVNGNGVSLDFYDVNDNIAYSLKTVDNGWAVLGQDGKYLTVVPNVITDNQEKSFAFRIIIDIDDAISTTYIDNKNVGTYPLISNSILNFRFATDETSKVKATPGAVNIVANYASYDNFDLFGTDEVYGWTTNAAKTENGELALGENNSAKKVFNKVSGKVSAQTYMLVAGNDASYTLYDGSNIVTAVSVVNGKLFVNGTELYTCTQNMWYRLRADVDTNAKTAKIWLNGRVIGNIALSGITGIDSVEFKSGAGTTAKFDNSLVYNTFDHADYVPEPTTKANLDDYVVGMNICSLWKNGEHMGWACITPYDEPKTVLGYYDEGNIESADWEIKYMVEHGIDFQAFCWYNTEKTGPTKSPKYASQLHEGYMYSKYSDYMKYTLIWEVTNSVHCNAEYFRNSLVPYWFENYFLDERYLKLDNQIVLCLFGADNLVKSSYFGSKEAAKAELDYLEDVAKSYGFDGIIIMSGNGDSNLAADLGIEAKYAYGWSYDGNKYTHNRDSILSSAENTRLYTVPTVSTGFDSIPWAGKRYGNIPVNEYEQAHNWVKTQYLPNYANKGTWQEKLVMLSNWNEYGEGTYLMPAGLNGFGYLDVLRKAYTTLGDAHEDLVPTANQSERFNHLYAQYARLLRHDGWLDKNKKAVGTLVINDVPVESGVVSESSNVGTLFPFDPATGVAYLMNVHYTWRKDLGTLNIEGYGHTVEYLVGSSKYKVDGNVKDLGYVLYLRNGLPMLSFKTLSEALDLTFEENDAKIQIKTEQYDQYVSANAANEACNWEFNGVTTEGWTSSNVTLSCENGILKMSSKSSDNYDPMMILNKQKVPADAYIGMEIKVRYDYTTKNSKPHNLTLYFLTDRDSQWNEQKAFGKSLSSLNSGDEWEVFTVDFTKNANWRDTITTLRFDPFNGVGTMEIDYIRFVPNPDYVYVDPATIPFGISNGDAEDTDYVAFFGANNKINISIVEDPRNSSNHVYKVETKDGKVWGYFRQNVNFKNNYKYKYSFDICYVGNNSGENAGSASSYMVNFVYSDKDEQTDHPLPKQNLTKGEWTKVTGEYTVTGLTEADGNQFSLFVNPEGDFGPIYYIDNVVVTELGVDEEAQKQSEKDDQNSSANQSTENLGSVKPLENAGVLTGIIPHSSVSETFGYDDAENAYVLIGKKAKSWTYFDIDTKFENGKTYTVSYDIKLTGNAKGRTSVESQISLNIRYSDNSNGYDHVAGRQKLSVKDGWVHCEYTYKVENMASAQKANQISLFADPKEDLAMNFMIKNIMVTADGVSTNAQSQPSENTDDTTKVNLAAAKPLENAGMLTGITPYSSVSEAFGYDETEKAYVLIGKKAKSWTYLNVDTKFEEGKTYTVSYDIMLTGNANGSTNAESQISLNLRYSDNSNAYDHVAGRTKLSVKDGWVHCEFTYTVENMASAQKANQVCVFADPKEDLAMNFMIKNIKISVN